MSPVDGGRNDTQNADASLVSPESRCTRPTIGYLAPRIGDNVSQALWSGVADAALKVASFDDRTHPLPMVSITLPMAGIPTVSIDSYQGMRAMIAH